MDKLIPDPPSPTALLGTMKSTATRPFGVRDSCQQALFTVRAGINAEDALVHASLLLKCAIEIAYEMTDNSNSPRGLVWSVIQLGETAQALVDAVLDGADISNKQR